MHNVTNSIDRTASNSKPRNSKPPAKRRLDVHEFKLLKAKNDGTEIRFNTAEGALYGKVTNFDKFSVVVLDKKTNEEVVIFKHGITSFTPSKHNITVEKTEA